MSQENTPPTEGTPRFQREQTDESLRKERNRPDEAMAAKRKFTQDMADDIVERAREQADEVLHSAREKADEKLQLEAETVTSSQETAHQVVNQERVEEDQALMQERASADSNLRWERKEQARILASLLPMEREKTDRYLLTEREHSDDAVAHRDDFLGMVSHDLRDLLSGIALHAHLLSKQASDSDEGKRTVVWMNRIERYVARMNRLIGDLVDVASIDAGKFAVHPQPGDLAELISEAVASFQPLAHEKGISLTSAHSGTPSAAMFDRERVLQVIANLISNAMRFTPESGEITLDAGRMGEDFRVSLFDTGVGIAPEAREAIFQRYGQAGGNAHKGLGMGLYISRCIVDAQGGRIWADANPAGTGSVFHFTIPVAAQPNHHRP